MKEANRPTMRIHPLNRSQAIHGKPYVLYWMTENRRLGSNHALDRAMRWAKRLEQPLLIVESLDLDPSSTARRHRFILDGMAANVVESIERGFDYFPFVETKAGQTNQLLADLAKHSGAVVADLPKKTTDLAVLYAAAKAFNQRVEAVDASGLFPIPSTLKRDAFGLKSTTKQSNTHENVALNLGTPPVVSPDPQEIEGHVVLPSDITSIWTFMGYDDLLKPVEQTLALNKDIASIPLAGGRQAALIQLKKRFEMVEAGSRKPKALQELLFGLMPYLRHGHIGPYEAMEQLDTIHAHLPSRFSRVGRRMIHAFLTGHEAGLVIEYKRDENNPKNVVVPPYFRRLFEQQRKAVKRVDWWCLANGETDDEKWNRAQMHLVQQGRLPENRQRYWLEKLFEWSNNWCTALETTTQLLGRFSLMDGQGCVYSIAGIMLGSYLEPSTLSIHDAISEHPPWIKKVNPQTFRDPAA